MATFTSQEFISKLNNLGGPSRNNKFDVVIDTPNNVQTHFATETGLPYSSENLTLLCQSVSIPYKSIATSEHRIYGFTEFRPHSINFDKTTTLTFILNDTNHYVKSFFDSWMDYIISSNTESDSTFNLNYLVDYSSTITVTSRNLDLGLIKETKILTAFPISVGALQYSYRNNEISTLDVTMAFDRWIATKNAN